MVVCLSCEDTAVLLLAEVEVVVKVYDHGFMEEFKRFCDEDLVSEGFDGERGICFFCDDVSPRSCGVDDEGARDF